VYVDSLILEAKVLKWIGAHENIVTLLGINTKKIHTGKFGVNSNNNNTIKVSIWYIKLNIYKYIIKSGVAYVLLELCPLGSLLNYLRSHRDNFV